MRPSVLIACLLTAVFTFSSNPATATSDSLTFRSYGAARTVSGSLHVLDFGGDLYVIDAGAFMGGDGENHPWPADLPVEDIRAVFITHAHSDHIGRIPLLLQQGYTGPIYMNEVTRDLSVLALVQNIGLSDFGMERFYYSRNNENERKPVYLEGYDFGQYTVRDYNRVYFEARRAELYDLGYYLAWNQAEQLRAELRAQLDRQTVLLEPGSKSSVGPFEVELQLTSHMPGASMLRLSIGGFSIIFSGDVGSDGSPFLPATVPWSESAQVLVLEGTYAEDRALDYAEERLRFQRRVGGLLQNGSRVIIPAFVLDRTQQVLFELQSGMAQGIIPRTDVFVCSSSAADFTDQYLHYAAHITEYGAYFTEAMQGAGFGSPRTGNCTDSNGDLKIGHGQIAILSSGMAEYAFARQALIQWVDDPETAFYFVGYQGPGTPGHDLTVRAVTELELDGERLPVRATILRTSGFSGHGTPSDMERIFANVNPELLLLVHHEEEVGERLAERYTRSLDTTVLRPELGLAITLPLR